MHFSEIVLGILLGWYSAFFFVEFATAFSRELGVKAVPYTTFFTNIFVCKIFSTPQDVPLDLLSNWCSIYESNKCCIDDKDFAFLEYLLM